MYLILHDDCTCPDRYIIELLKREKTMIKYIAIGKAQYHDSKDQVRQFKSKNDYEARHHIINYFDSSLIWTFTRNNSQKQLN